MPDGSLPKYQSSETWSTFTHYHAGSYEAVFNSYPKSRTVPLSADGSRQLYLKFPGTEPVAGAKLIDVEVVPRLGWDVRTALRFARSCQPTQ